MKKTFLFFGIIITIFVISCGSNAVKILSSANDGPYIYYVNNEVAVITLDSSNDPDTLYLNEEELSGTIFRCVFDSLSCPHLEFKLHSENSIDADSIAMPDKMLVLSDIEGNFNDFYKLLLGNGVIDKDYNWIFGNGHLVIVGDIVDRGDYVTQCLWLTYKLEQQAELSGGKVHFLLGNHERMIMTGDDRYVSEKYLPVYAKLNTEASQLFSDSTELGKWLRTKNAVLKAGDLIFVHAGISQEILPYDLNITRINSEIRSDIDSKEFKTKESEFLFSSFGVLWYRGLAMDNDKYKKITESALDEVLNKYRSKAIVIGHTIVDSVSTDYSGKVISVDVYHYENCTALLIENGKYYVVDGSGKRKKLR